MRHPMDDEYRWIIYFSQSITFTDFIFNESIVLLYILLSVSYTFHNDNYCKENVVFNGGSMTYCPPDILSLRHIAPFCQKGGNMS